MWAALQPQCHVHQGRMATEDPLDIAKPTFPAQNLGEGAPGAVVGAYQDMEEPWPGIKDLLQGTGPCEVWHDLGIDGGLIRHG